MDPTIHLERGRPLRDGEYNIKFSLYHPKDVDLGIRFHIDEMEESSNGSNGAVDAMQLDDDDEKPSVVTTENGMSQDAITETCHDSHKLVRLCAELRKPSSGLNADVSMRQEDIEFLFQLVLSKESKVMADRDR